MNKHLREALRRCVTYKKELQSIWVGLAFAYGWQVWGYLMGWLIDHEAMSTEYLIPNWGIMLAIAPMVAWACFGLFKVSWIKQWVRVTLCGLAFIIPFDIISVGVIFIGKASLWRSTMFWAGNITISVIIGLTMFRLFIKFKN